MATSVDDLRSPRFWRAVVAEFVGTLFLVFIGCGSCLTWGPARSDKPTMVQMSLSFGLSVATMVWCIGNCSGGHINPAVTAAMLVTRHVSVAKAILYVILQCAGAIAGAALLLGVTPSEFQGNLGSTLVNENLTPAQGFGVEFLITFVLVFTVFASVDSKRDDLGGSVPLTIGLSVTLCHLTALRYTGSSMNPARSFGPAVIMGTWENHWVYWCGPLLGGIAAGFLYETLFAANASLVKTRGYLLSSTYDRDEFSPIKDEQYALEVVDKVASL